MYAFTALPCTPKFVPKIETRLEESMGRLGGIAWDTTGALYENPPTKFAVCPSNWTCTVNEDPEPSGGAHLIAVAEIHAVVMQLTPLTVANGDTFSERKFTPRIVSEPEPEFTAFDPISIEICGLHDDELESHESSSAVVGQGVPPPNAAFVMGLVRARIPVSQEHSPQEVHSSVSQLTGQGKLAHEFDSLVAGHGAPPDRPWLMTLRSRFLNAPPQVTGH
jgi:hypothetical protein